MSLYTRNRTGTYSELMACAWLIEQGYEVFRNVSATGPIDVVAIKNESVLRIDVKTSHHGCIDGHGYISRAQAAQGIILLIVDSNTGSCWLDTNPIVVGSKRRLVEKAERLEAEIAAYAAGLTAPPE